jgi:hypothetical protein
LLLSPEAGSGWLVLVSFVLGWFWSNLIRYGKSQVGGRDTFRKKGGYLCVYLWLLWVEYVKGSEGQPSTLPDRNCVPSCSFAVIERFSAG